MNPYHRFSKTRLSKTQRLKIITTTILCLPFIMVFSQKWFALLLLFIYASYFVFRVVDEDIISTTNNWLRK